MSKIFIHVNPEPEAPVIDAGDDQTIAYTEAQLIGEILSNGGSPINSILWVLQSSPSNAAVTFVGGNTLYPLVTFLDDEFGNYVFLLTVTNQYGVSAQDTVVITVEDDDTYYGGTASSGIDGGGI